MEEEQVNGETVQVSPPKHPWQSGPKDLLIAAIEHLHRNTNRDNLIAFLLVDIGVELLSKTYLTLPLKPSECPIPYKEREASARGRFHILLDCLGKAARKKLSGIDLRHVQYFHGLRNKIYHQGDGFTVPGEKAEDYATLAVDLLKALLGVDLSSKLRKPQIQNELEAAKDRLRREKSGTAAELKVAIDMGIVALEKDIELAIEKIEPRFLLPSFQRDFTSILESYLVEVQDEFGCYSILTQDPTERQALAGRISALLDSVFENPKTQAQFNATSIIIETLWDAATEPPPLKSLYSAIVKIVIPLEDDTLWEKLHLAELYPDTFPDEDPEKSEEEYWDLVLQEGEALIQDIKKLRLAIKHWTETRQLGLETFTSHRGTHFSD